MHTFCPFIKDTCREDCVFWIQKKSADAFAATNCRLVSAAGDLEFLGAITRYKLDNEDE